MLRVPALIRVPALNIGTLLGMVNADTGNSCNLEPNQTTLHVGVSIVEHNIQSRSSDCT